MNWKNYSHLRKEHAFLSPSKFHWKNYSPERLKNAWLNQQKIVIGTKLHKFAEDAINLKIHLPKTKSTINAFVNDALGYRMETEKVLYYSPYCYGTADAISFEDGVLRIHDLKTGDSPGKMEQLEIYAALFCLDYEVNPNDITMFLRIYQNDQVFEYEPSSDSIMELMIIIQEHNSIIQSLEASL